MEKRKVIQIAIDSQPGGQDWNAWTDIVALCDDGSIWRITNKSEWVRIPDIPQGDE